MSKIHFIGGEKGGIGKSVLARLMAQYHINHSLPFRAFDSDQSHGALLRFYRDYSQPILLDDFESADRLMESAIARNRDILVDLAAQTSLPLHRRQRPSGVGQRGAGEGGVLACARRWR